MHTKQFKWKAFYIALWLNYHRLVPSVQLLNLKSVKLNTMTIEESKTESMGPQDRRLPNPQTQIYNKTTWVSIPK